MSTVPAKTQFAFRIAEGVFKGEVRSQRMLGADWVETYTRAWAVLDEAYNYVLDSRDRPFIHLEARTITGKGLPL